MAWIVLTEDHLKTRLSGVELEAFREAALATGQADPIDDILSDVVEEVRGFVGGCRSNTLGAAGTIPGKLKSAALDIAVMKVCQRAAGIVIDPSGVRKDAADRAYKTLVLVADCKVAIEEPEEASDESIAAAGPSFTGRTREFNRTTQDGV